MTAYTNVPIQWFDITVRTGRDVNDVALRPCGKWVPCKYFIYFGIRLCWRLFSWPRMFQHQIKVHQCWTIMIFKTPWFQHCLSWTGDTPLHCLMRSFRTWWKSNCFDPLHPDKSKDTGDISELVAKIWVTFHLMIHMCRYGFGLMKRNAMNSPVF